MTYPVAIHTYQSWIFPPFAVCYFTATSCVIYFSLSSDTLTITLDCASTISASKSILQNLYHYYDVTNIQLMIDVILSICLLPTSLLGNVFVLRFSHDVNLEKKLRKRKSVPKKNLESDFFDWFQIVTVGESNRKIKWNGSGRSRRRLGSVSHRVQAWTLHPYANR